MLSDIDIIVDDLQKKSDELLSDAERMGQELAEQQRQQEVKDRIRKLANNKLDYRVLDTIPRNRSFTKLAPSLFDPEEEDRLSQIEMKPGSPKGANREKMLRPIINSKKEYDKDAHGSTMNIGEESELASQIGGMGGGFKDNMSAGSLTGGVNDKMAQMFGQFMNSFGQGGGPV